MLLLGKSTAYGVGWLGQSIVGRKGEVKKVHRGLEGMATVLKAGLCPDACTYTWGREKG